MAIQQESLEKLVNKDTTTTLGTSDIKYPSQKAVKTYVDSLGIATNTIRDLSLNIILNAFRLAQIGSLTIFSMINGFMDEYENESGVDTANSTNELYNSTDDYYYNGSSGIDSNTKLMLHCNGTDASTTFTDETSRHTPSAIADAQIDTADKKFGTGSLLLDGTGDYLDITDNLSDFDVHANTTDDWTIDCWCKVSALNKYIIQGFKTDDNDAWTLAVLGTTGFWYNLYVGSSQVLSLNGNAEPSGWTHVAVVKKGNVYGLYVDGVQKDYGTTSSTLSGTTGCHIGANYTPGGYYNGWIDELRVQKSNIFNASPNVGETDTITVPTAEATGVDNMTLLSNAQVAESVPTSARIVLFEEDVDAITLNTDLKAYVSRNNGTTYTQVTLEDVGNYITAARVLQGVVDISGQSSGTNMKYKVETLNEKMLRLHGVGISWQ